jgi:hypothetical protein
LNLIKRSRSSSLLLVRLLEKLRIGEWVVRGGKLAESLAESVCLLGVKVVGCEGLVLLRDLLLHHVQLRIVDSYSK